MDKTPQLQDNSPDPDLRLVQALIRERSGELSLEQMQSYLRFEIGINQREKHLAQRAKERAAAELRDCEDVLAVMDAEFDDIAEHIRRLPSACDKKDEWLAMINRK